jgi:superfamily I DNA and/or RNA helicase
MIAATVLRIYRLEQERFDPLETVGVIVPYRNQIAAVRNLLDRTHIPELHDITIDTVERYQGSQRRYIIYGFTVQQHYQLSFLTNNVFEDWDGSRIDRKLNVAMTRAEEHLILVGNARLLSADPIFFRLIEFVKGRSGYFEVPPEEYVRGEFEVPEFVGE